MDEGETNQVRQPDRERRLMSFLSGMVAKEWLEREERERALAGQQFWRASRDPLQVRPGSQQGGEIAGESLAVHRVEAGRRTTTVQLRRRRGERRRRRETENEGCLPVDSPPPPPPH